LTYEVIFTPGAAADLDEIRQYLALRFSERNAERYVRRIVSHCRQLALAPHRGATRDDIRPGLRSTGFERRATILFQILPETIVIHGIFYGGRAVDPNR
jgi:plasmid stabilization system protein ParE